MSKLKVNLSGVQSLFAAAILFAVTNVLVREIRNEALKWIPQFVITRSIKNQ